jgi:hypothetical protein
MACGASVSLPDIWGAAIAEGDIAITNAASTRIAIALFIIYPPEDAWYGVYKWMLYIGCDKPDFRPF